MYVVELGEEARRAFEDADASLQRRLDRCFDVLRADPYRSNNSKRLSGKPAGRWRYRVGDWRVIYRVDEPAQTVHVSEIGHRRDVYD